MSKLSIELDFLDRLRKELAKNISIMGVSAIETETLKDLIPKVLLISQGNPHTSYFLANFIGTPEAGNQYPIKNGQYRVFLYGEQVNLNNVLDIQGYFKMSSCKLTFTGKGLNNLNTTAPGWTINKNSAGTEMILSMDTNQINAGGLMNSKIDAIQFNSLSDVEVSFTFEATEKETGTVKKVTGSAYFKIQQNSWQHVENTYPTAGTFSAYTWKEVEHLVFDNRPAVWG